MRSISHRNVFTAVFILTLAALGGSLVVFAWTGPTATPPNGNVPAPVNVGTASQIKDGGLGVNTLAVYGNEYIQGRLGIGTTEPAAPLHVNGPVAIRGANPPGSGKNPVGSWSFGVDPDGRLSFYSNSPVFMMGTFRMVMDDNSGRIGIGTNNPAQLLHVNGIVRATRYENQSGGPPISCHSETRIVSGQTADVSCPAGYIATGGGGSCDTGSLRSSIPLNNAWRISCAQPGDNRVQVVCCR